MNAIRINLLPHRQMRRAMQQRIFALLAVVTAIVAVAALAAGQIFLSTLNSGQTQRNEFLKSETAKLDQQINEIRKLKEKTQDLLSRKNVVETLQANRTIAVRLMDELARQLPEGLYLKGFKQTGMDVALAGYAQSSARVSSFMRALDATELFQDPVLVEVKAATVGKARINEFSLRVKVTGPQKAEGGKP